MKRGHVVAMSLAAALMGIATVNAIGAERRYAPLTMETLKPEQKTLGEQVMKVSSVGLAGPYAPLLRSPVMGQAMFDLMGYLRFKKLSNRENPAQAIAQDVRIVKEAGDEY